MRITTIGGMGEMVAPNTLLLPVFLHGERTYVDTGALHSSSQLENSMTFVLNRSDVGPGAQTIWLCWVSVKDPDGDNGYYYGVTSVPYLINPMRGVGYRSAGDVSSRMGLAVVGRREFGSMGPGPREQLREALIEIKREWWQCSDQNFRDTFLAAESDGGW